MKNKKKLPKFNTGGANKQFDPSASMGWYQYAKGASDMGRGAISRDETGMATTSEGRVMDANMTATHELAMEDFKKGNTAAGVADLLGGGKLARVASYGLNKENETTGFWGKTNRIMGFGAYDKSKQVDNSAEIEANKNEMLNKLQYGTFRQGGISYPTNAIPMHGGNWAIPTFNVGGTFQVDGPSHEQGGVVIPTPNGDAYEVEKEEVIQRTPQADRILSDSNKLKLPSTGKNPAQSYKPFQNKLDKLNKLSKEGKLDKYSAKSLELTQKAADKAFNSFYDEQEDLKVTKANNYIKRMGGIQKFPDGGYADWRKQKEAAGWVQSPLADPKSPYPDMYDPKALDIQKTSNVGINDHVWKAYDNTDYTYKALNPKALDAFGYKSPDFYGSYTPPVTKKAVSTQQFKTGYTPSPEGGSYMMINDPNPNARYQYIGGAYQPIQKQAYGGVQKFGDGGGYEEPSFGYTPDNLAGQYKLQQAYNNQKLYEESLAQYEAAMNEHNKYSSINPNNPYNPTFNFNMPVGGPLDQAILKDKNYSYKENSTPQRTPVQSTTNDRTDTFTRNGSEEVPYNRDLKESLNDKKEPKKDDKGNKFNKDAAFQAGMLLANNAGPLAYMLGEGKKHDKQKFYKYTPSELDFEPTRRRYDSRRRAVLQNVKNMAAGHSGTALANIAAQNADLNVSEDNAMREFANQMAGIRNQAQQFNIQGQYAVDDINARNKGQALTNYYKAIGQLGTNTAQAGRDYRMTSQEKEMLPFMQSAFSDPAFIAMYQDYLKKKGVA